MPVEPVERTELELATGRRSIPILVAGHQTVDGERAILGYLDEHFAEPPGALAQRAKAAKAKRKELEEACPKLAAATR